MRCLLPILLLFSLGLAGCGELPRPFKPTDQKAAVDLRALTYSSTVVVMPPDGDMPPDPGPITEALRDALLAEGLIATTWRESEGGLQLTGRAEVRQLDAAHDLVAVAWSIDDSKGPLARYDQQRTLPAGAWQSGDPQALDELAAEAAQALAPQLLAPAPEEALLPGFPGARLAVEPVTGAPGDGNEALTAALRLALQRAELPLTEAAGERDLRVLGEVEMTPAGEGKEEVAIVWRLEDPAGKELGRISQANDVEAGSLDGRWGTVAVLVARGAADGLTDLLDRLARQRAAN